ncbi:MAG: NfeD family protein [Verrucomicrobiota bacterium]
MTVILVLCAIGILAILAELVLPGGLLGIVGALCLLVAVGLVFVEYGTTAGAIALGGLFLLALATLNWWMRFFHKLPLTRKLILHEEVKEDPGKEATDSLIGKSGLTVTDLMPSGRVEVEGIRHDALAESGSISKETPVTIVSRSGPSLVVRANEVE